MIKFIMQLKEIGVSVFQYIYKFIKCPIVCDKLDKRLESLETELKQWADPFSCQSCRKGYYTYKGPQGLAGELWKCSSCEEEPPQRWIKKINK